MADFGARFGNHQENTGIYIFEAWRQGLIVSMVPMGALGGSPFAGWLADFRGRRSAISGTAFAALVGTAIEISASNWIQYIIGRLISGLSVGCLSVIVPMYLSESAPAHLRGILVSGYQLFITLGILIAEIVNLGTHRNPGSASWRIPTGLGFVWATILGVGMLFLPESPRFAFRCGRHLEARTTIARLLGVNRDDPIVSILINDIRVKLLEEQSQGGKARWTDIFRRKLSRRLFIGVVLMAGQQLTGANFFFYFGTTVFKGAGVTDPYVTQMILGAVNVLCTLGGLWVVGNVGRRKALICGALWMAMCFLVFAFVGKYMLDPLNPMSTPAAGMIMIIFSCFFIAAFASTWGPLVWAVVAELYPAPNRGPAMAVATAFNWLFNTLISIFTRPIIDQIGFMYGLVFAGCCIFLAVFVYLLLIESKDRTLEEIETLYNSRTSARKSARLLGPNTPGPSELDIPLQDTEATAVNAGNANNGSKRDGSRSDNPEVVNVE